jgi:thiol-disulfide isomerase/thioredoxin
MVIPVLLTHGQKLPPTSDAEMQKKSDFLKYYGLTMPGILPNSTLDLYANTDLAITDAFEQDKLTSGFSTWNNSTKGFSQASTTVLFADDFNPATYGSAPYGWTITGNCTSWIVYAGTYAGGTTPELSFMHYPVGFNGYTRLIIDTTLNTTGFATLALSLKTILKYNNTGFTVRIETTSDNGTTWNTAWERIVNSNYEADSLLIIINTPDVGSDNFQFALSFQGSNMNVSAVKFDDLLLTEGPLEVSDITFNLHNYLDSTAVENAKITLEDYGSLSSDANGQVVFKNVVPGNYAYNIIAQNLAIIKDTLDLADNNLTLDIYMKEPIYLYYEDFTIEPNGWKKHLTDDNRIFWENNTMRFNRGNDGDLLYVTPAIDLYKDSTIVIEVGGALNTGTMGIGVVTDPNDPSTYKQIAEIEVESGYQYYDYRFPEEDSLAKYLGFKHLSGVDRDFNLTTMYLEPKSIYIPRTASFIVKDTEGNFLKDAQVSLQANGTKTTDSIGQVSFNSVYEGTYEWSVNAGLDYSRSSGTLIIEQTDTVIEVEMQVPAYYFFDDFMAGQINDWTFLTSGTKQCRWNNGAIFFYHTETTNAPLFAVSPKIDLSQVASVTAYVGGNTNGTGVMTFGTLTDPTDSTTFTPMTSFNLSLSYQYFSVNITEYTGTDKYFAFKSEGEQYNFHYMPMVFMEAKPTAVKYPITFIVKNENDQLCKDAKIEIPGFGPVFTDTEGKAPIELYSNKTYEYTVTGDGLFERNRTVNVGNAAKTVNVPVKIKGDYFFLEEFEAGIPFTWKQIVTTGDYIDWWGGEILFYNYLDSEDPLMIVSPEINLSKVDAITVETGKELINHGSIVIGSLTDPTNPATFQELGTVAAEYELEFYTIDVSDIAIEGSYLGFKCEGTTPSFMVLKTIYVEGHGVTEYCMDSTLNKDGWISNVEFDDINNASDWQPEVGDYTNISTRLQTGKSELITVTNGNPKETDNVTVWVDWDQNFEYEAEMGEEYILSSIDGGSTFTAEITVPESIEYGRCPMRIRLTNATTVAPCGELNNGETEDYVIKVTEELYSPEGIVFEDNFDAYLVDDYVACQNPDNWNTSNNNPCGSKDVLVSNAQAYSGTNSANVIKGDDLIMELDKYLTLGMHSVSSMIYVPTGGEAYYALLSAYNPDATLAFEVSFSADGSGTVNAGGTDAATFSFTPDTWITSKVVIDLANDSAEFLLDDASIIKWQYTAGATGNGCAAAFGALRLSGSTDASNYFIDDVIIETMPVYPPTNFRAEVVDGNDVEMKWSAPLGEETISWAGKNNYGALGFGGATPFWVASKWNPDDLKAYDGNYITSITFFPKVAGTFTLKAWIGEAGETLILNQELSSVNVGTFNTVELETPILINAFDDLWFGYKVTNYNGSVAGYDYGPAIEGKGNLMSLDGVSWYTLSSYSRDYNWNLSAYVSATANGKTLAKPMVKENVALAADLNAEAIFSTEVNESYKASSTNTKVAEGFIGYTIYRNGEMLVDSLTKTSFTDTSLLEGTYSYEVKAVYNEGISASAEPGALEFFVGSVVPRDFVVVEIRTGTWCQYCPGAALAVDEFVENGDRVAVIEYHTSDDYTTAETDARLAVYSETGAPTAWFDGIISYGGGNATTSIYSVYQPLYETRINVPSLFELESYYYNTDGDNYILDISIEMISNYSNMNNLKVFAALTESHIEESWMGGLEELNFVCRDLIPDANGTATDFANDAVQSFKLEFPISADYDKDHIEVVVFLQDMSTKEVLQGTIALEGEAPLAIPTNLTGPDEVLINTDFNLTWDAVNAGSNTFTGYNVYRQINTGDFELVSTTTETSYVDNITESSTVNYYVTAVYDEGESPASNTLTVDIITGIVSSVYKNTELFPNPATKLVNIESKYIIESISVYNCMGQKVINETVNNKSYRVKTSGLNTGIYLFQIETEMGKIAKQIIIEK